jgi:hypothetical protein
MRLQIAISLTAISGARTLMTVIRSGWPHIDDTSISHQRHHIVQADGCMPASCNEHTASATTAYTARALGSATDNENDSFSSPSGVPHRSDGNHCCAPGRRRPASRPRPPSPHARAPPPRLPRPPHPSALCAASASARAVASASARALASAASPRVSIGERFGGLVARDRRLVRSPPPPPPTSAARTAACIPANRRAPMGAPPEGNANHSARSPHDGDHVKQVVEGHRRGAFGRAHALPRPA